MAIFHKPLFAPLGLLLIFAGISPLLPAQELTGRLFILNEGTFGRQGSLGYIAYPEGIYHHIDSIAAYGNQVVLDNNMLVALDGNGNLQVYDETTFQLQQSLPLGGRQMQRYNANQVLVASNQQPYFRVFDSNTGSIIYTLDTLAIPTAREGMVIQGDTAYVYGFNNDTVVYVVNLVQQQVVATIATAANNNWGATIAGGLILIGCPNYFTNQTVVHTISNTSVLTTDTLSGYLSYCGHTDTSLYLKGYQTDVVVWHPFSLQTDTLAGTGAAYTFAYHAPTGVGFYSLTDYATTGSVGYWYDDTLLPAVETHISPRAYFFSGTFETGIQPEKPALFSLSPNPASDRLYVRPASDAAISWQVHDLAGRTLLHGSGNVVDCSLLPAGFYQLAVVQAGATAVRPFSVVR